MKPLSTEQTRREANGWPDPLDQFLSKKHSLPERIKIAEFSKTTVPYLEGLIMDATFGTPQEVLQARLNLNLTLHAAGARR